MRLINTANYELRQFNENDLPSYAILSHRWGHGEVNYQEWKDAQKSQVRIDSPGYRKIAKFCAIAKNDGKAWVWVDTCCINKSNSSELDAAIRSMFRWYQNAHTCYVYLDDIQGSKARNITTSRWWTRGWTLQELIAPKRVAFYNAQWGRFGSKQDFSREISKRTNIPEAVIEDTTSSLYKQCPHAQRLSWAAGRETTMTEDRAYSLQGICQVDMQTRYGEGNEAFMRLQMEIMGNFAGESLLAWKPPVHRSQVDNVGVLATSVDAFQSCANLSVLGKHSSKGFKPRRTGPGFTKRDWVTLTALAIPLWPKPVEGQPKPVQRDLRTRVPPNYKQPKYWAIPLTTETKDSKSAEYSSILVVAERDTQPGSYKRVECFHWHPSHEARDEQLSRFYEIGRPSAQDKVFHLQNTSVY
jgi:hypothetical protein